MKRADWNVLICGLGCAVLVACGAPGVPIPPTLELARPVSDLHAARKGDNVYLVWSVPARTTDRQTVRHPGPTRICRSLKIELRDCAKPVAEIAASRFPLPRIETVKGTTAAKVQASYTDTLPRELQKEDPTADLTYAISALNESGRSAGLSNLVKVPSAPTLPPPEHFNAQVESDGVLLSWDCPQAADVEANPAIGYRLRIYRRELYPNELYPNKQGKQNDTRVGEVNFAGCAQNQPPQFLDQSFEWEKRYDYHATVVTVVSQIGAPEAEVEGDDTPAIQVFAHDVFPPAAPTGLQAVFSGIGQAPFVDLVWSPDSEADLAGYNVYRHEEGAQPVKLNAEPVKAPAYRDPNVQSGRKYFYAVAAVDEHGNESTRSEEAVEQVP
ncbi:MAG: hypothetical protein WB755_06535 [Terriglobales bacterium]